MFNARNYAHAISVTGLSVMLLAVAISPAAANDSPVIAANVPTVATAISGDLAATPVTITLAFEGKDSNYTTEAKTFGDFLAEIGFHVSADDFLSVDASAPLVDGMHAEYRAAVPLTVVYEKRKYSLHTSAMTLDEALANARIATGSRDFFSVSRRSMPREGEIVRITTPKHETIAVKARGTKHVASNGKRKARKLASRKLASVQHRSLQKWHRHPAPAVVAVAAPHVTPSIVAPITHLASSVSSGAMHFAGSVLHVIATAYIAGCYKCSGITASGVRAGFGIIAVDPHLIPLGTKLMIPGYGRAIAGDTGGAIIGHRVDLGMNTLADAIRFGRRPMTVYVLK